jgi:hypothetical protein
MRQNTPETNPLQEAPYRLAFRRNQFRFLKTEGENPCHA